MATSGCCGHPARDPGPIRKILEALGEPLEPPPVSPARGPPIDWGKFVPVHDDRAIFQGRIDELPVIDSQSLWKNATEADAGRFEKPVPDARAAPPDAHESLISRKTSAEVPLTGLSVAGREIAKVVAVPGRLVNFVLEQ